MVICIWVSLFKRTLASWGYEDYELLQDTHNNAHNTCVWIQCYLKLDKNAIQAVFLNTVKHFLIWHWLQIPIKTIKWTAFFSKSASKLYVIKITCFCLAMVPGITAILCECVCLCVCVHVYAFFVFLCVLLLFFLTIDLSGHYNDEYLVGWNSTPDLLNDRLKNVFPISVYIMELRLCHLCLSFLQLRCPLSTVSPLNLLFHVINL